jgi:MSHA biogenesis protein MshJ
MNLGFNGNLLHDLKRRLQALQPRERIALFAVAVVLTLFLWDSGIMQQLERRHSNANASLAQLDAASSDTAGVLPEIAAVAELAERARKLAADEQAARLQLQQRAAAFVEPDEVVSLVRDLLRARAGLKLTRLATVEPEQLDAVAGNVADAGAAAAASATGAGPTATVEMLTAARPPAIAYLHGIELNVEGSYQEVYDYLRALEAQHWHVLWRGLELEVGEYPQLRARIKLATVSIDRNWTGI